MYSYGPPHMAEQNQDDQLEHTYSSYVRIRDVVLMTCRRRWTIGRSDERGSGISVLATRHDDDDDDDMYKMDLVFNICNCWYAIKLNQTKSDKTKRNVTFMEFFFNGFQQVSTLAHCQEKRFCGKKGIFLRKF